MKNKQQVTSVSRQAWELLELSKSSTMQNIANAVASGELSVDRNQLPKLLMLVQSSIEEGYAKGLKEFETQVSNLLEPSVGKKK